MKFLVNSFTPGMLEKFPAFVVFDEITVEEFCRNIKDSTNAIGHASTADIINELCGTNITTNRIQIKAKEGDILYIFTLTIRVEEGKVLSKEELSQLLAEGKIKFTRAVILSKRTIDDLVSCKGKCDERTYDSIATELETQLKGEQQ